MYKILKDAGFNQTIILHNTDSGGSLNLCATHELHRTLISNGIIPDFTALKEPLDIEVPEAIVPMLTKLAMPMKRTTKVIKTKAQAPKKKVVDLLDVIYQRS